MKIIIEMSKEEYEDAKEGIIPCKTCEILAKGEPMEDYIERVIQGIAEVLFKHIKY